MHLIESMSLMLGVVAIRVIIAGRNLVGKKTSGPELFREFMHDTFLPGKLELNSRDENGVFDRLSMYGGKTVCIYVRREGNNGLEEVVEVVELGTKGRVEITFRNGTLAFYGWKFSPMKGFKKYSFHEVIYGGLNQWQIQQTLSRARSTAEGILSAAHMT
jgi:hypothetical protein